MDRIFKLVFGLALFLGFAAYVYRTSVFRITKNFETVDHDKLYRSAQLTTSELDQIVKDHNIKTVISLRGWPNKTKYYDAEDKTLKRLNVKFVPLDFDDRYYPPEKELRELLTTFEKGSYPMLIHCRVGADRTGLAAALYQQIYMNKSVDESLKQLTFANWHVPLFKPAMTDFVRKFKGSSWAKNEYRICDPEFSKYREIGYDCKNN